MADGTHSRGKPSAQDAGTADVNVLADASTGTARSGCWPRVSQSRNRPLREIAHELVTTGRLSALEQP
jgi:hypothetical protein